MTPLYATVKMVSVNDMYAKTIQWHILCTKNKTILTEFDNDAQTYNTVGSIIMS